MKGMKGMNIKNKNIITNEQKQCSICNSVGISYGITILNNYICGECLQKITEADVNDSSYYKLKDKIKSIIMKNL